MAELKIVIDDRTPREGQPADQPMPTARPVGYGEVGPAVATSRPQPVEIVGPRPVPVSFAGALGPTGGDAHKHDGEGDGRGPVAKAVKLPAPAPVPVRMPTPAPNPFVGLGDEPTDAANRTAHKRRAAAGKPGAGYMPDVDYTRPMGDGGKEKDGKKEGWGKWSYDRMGNAARDAGAAASGLARNSGTAALTAATGTAAAGLARLGPYGMAAGAALQATTTAVTAFKSTVDAFVARAGVGRVGRPTRSVVGAGRCARLPE